MPPNYAIPGLMDLQTPRSDSVCSSAPTLTLKAGQIWDMPVTFTDSSGAPLDLTGSVVFLMAKVDYDDEDGEAVLDISQSTHIDAEAGETTLHMDLSELSETYFTKGAQLIADLWVEDSVGHRLPYGTIVLNIEPSMKWKPAS